jgi:hypothetical protein
MDQEANRTAGRCLEDLASRMGATGWSVSEESDATGGLAPLTSYSRPVGDGVLAVVSVAVHLAHLSEDDDGSGPRSERASSKAFLSSLVWGAVEYEPTTRALRSIDDRRHARLRVDGRNLDAELSDPPATTAARLEEVFRDKLLPAIESRSSLESILRGWRQSEPQLAVLTLAAAGRVDKARQALDRWVARFGAAGPDWIERRSVRQTRRLLDAGGSLPEPPEPRPQREVPRAKIPNVLNAWREAKDQRETEERLRVETAGLDRATRRNRVQQEMARRGIPLPAQKRERLLDRFEQPQPPSFLDRFAANARAVGGVALGVGDVVVRMASGGLKEPIPNWLEPPERAGYPVNDETSFPRLPFRTPLPELTRGGWIALSARVDEESWVEVALDFGRGTSELLDRALVASPNRVQDTGTVPAWLEPADQDGSTAGSRHPNLVVNIGSDRIGTLGGESAARFAGAVRRAAHFDELPWAPCRLTKLRAPGAYAVEVCAWPD